MGHGATGDGSDGETGDREQNESPSEASDVGTAGRLHAGLRASLGDNPGLSFVRHAHCSNDHIRQS